MQQPEPDELVAAIAATATTLRFDDLDDLTIERTKQLIFDALGTTSAGREADGARQLRELALHEGGRAEATIIGHGDRVPAAAAARVNATMCRAHDFDDVGERALMHPSANALPVALAAIQAGGRAVDGRELITTVALGIDLLNRISYAALDARDPDGGQRIVNTNSSVGFLVGATIAARLWGFDAERVVHAFGLGYSQACGNQQATLDSALAIRVQQGLTAGSGITAARLAELGVTGPTRSLEGRAGYYQVFWNGRYKRDLILQDLGRRFTVEDVSVKPYPCCKFSHTAMSAALDLREQHRPAIGDIAQVTVEVPSREYFAQVCEPVEQKRRPQNTVDAQFSLPYSVAVALRDGPPRIESFQPEALSDPELLELAARITPVHVETRREVLPAPSTVTIELTDGTTLTATCQVPEGHPDRPMSWEALEDKFARAAAFGPRPMPGGQVEAVAATARSLEDLDDVGAFVDRELCW